MCNNNILIMILQCTESIDSRMLRHFVLYGCVFISLVSLNCVDAAALKLTNIASIPGAGEKSLSSFQSSNVLLPKSSDKRNKEKIKSAADQSLLGNVQDVKAEESDNVMREYRDEPGREEPGREEPGREEPGREEPGREEPGREESERSDIERQRRDDKGTVIKMGQKRREEERMNADVPNNVLHVKQLIKEYNKTSTTKNQGMDEHGDKNVIKIQDEGEAALRLDELEPPDHVDGLRVEHDGHLNKEYKKEILLGEEHDEFDSEPGRKKFMSHLKVIFNSADADHDGYLMKEELEVWIMEKVDEHLREATRENNRIFKHLDTDRDGYVTWDEFEVHFLSAQSDERQKAKQDDSLKVASSDREKLVRYKFRWAEADESPQDDRLNREEMRNFRHPEQSPLLITRLAQDIIENLDDDEDGVITEREFVSLSRHGERMQPQGEEELGGEERGVREERRKEFRNVIDLNRDGKVTLDELKVYVDPHNAQHAQLEAENLIQLADENHDNKLSLQEVLSNAELFFGSKIINVGYNFHDEF